MVALVVVVVVVVVVVGCLEAVISQRTCAQG